jgi:hypothetical protein
MRKTFAGLTACAFSCRFVKLFDVNDHSHRAISKAGMGKHPSVFLFGANPGTVRSGEEQLGGIHRTLPSPEAVALLKTQTNEDRTIRRPCYPLHMNCGKYTKRK